MTIIKNPLDDMLDLQKELAKMSARRVQLTEPPVHADVATTLLERGNRYGEFKDHAVIAQGIQDVMRAAPNWARLDPDMRQALTVISDKIARILNGDPYYADNWHDIVGYATLVEKRVVKEA